MDVVRLPPEATEGCKRERAIGAAPSVEQVNMKMELTKAAYDFLGDIERQLDSGRQMKTQQRQFWATMFVGSGAALATAVYAIAYILSLRGCH